MHCKGYEMAQVGVPNLLVPDSVTTSFTPSRIHCFVSDGAIVS
jgi:hypothetical protein